MDHAAITKQLTSAKPGMLLHNAPPSAIDAMLKRGAICKIAKDDVVFREGDTAGWFYVLIDGTVNTQLHDTNVRTLVPGEIGGLTTSLPPPGKAGSKQAQQRSMTHIAMTNITILKIPHGVYRELLQDREFAVHAVSYLHGRVRSKTRALGLLTGHGSKEEAVQPQPGDLRIAVFDTKPYDREYFDAAFKSAAKATPRITLKYIDSKLNESTVGLAVGCQAVCIFVNDTCNDRVLTRLQTAGVKLVLLRCAGFNQVDLKKAKSLGFTVLRVPAYSPNAVAEHAFALLATVNRRTHRAYNRVRDGNFQLHGLEGRDLKGLTAGVAGCGKIGECFVSIARGCGMKVIVWDKFLSADKAKEMGAEKVETVDELFKRSDVLSLHVPLTDETKHLVNAERLKLMPKGAIVLNTSRGPIVDTKALAHALIEGRLGGAGLDVYEEEARYFFEDHSDHPIKDDLLARLVNLPNVVVTSHQAFLTNKALTAIAETTLDNAKSYQDASLKKEALGKSPNVVVDGTGVKQSKL